MVDFIQPKSNEELEKVLDKFFTYEAVTDISLDSQGRANVDGSLLMNKPLKGHVPVRFGKVTGYFLARGMGLTTLEGMPYHVGGTLNVAYNKLTDLKGGPTHVGDVYQVSGNDLKSLEGFPEHVKHFAFSYNDQLPLLRTLVAEQIWMRDHKIIEDIFQKHAGKGKAAALNFALDLKKAGYAGNARW